ncbi:Smf Predicted Rossmann fold nucleotide-binding protein involved in DNA uptake [Candidatus Nanopelagicaceae bacterium]
MNDLNARLALFASIEAGTSFWSHEISTHGALDVYTRLKSGGYDRIKYAGVIEKVETLDTPALLTHIRGLSAEFITPESHEWPQQVNDLGVPPIGLIVKGDLDSLSQPSLAIVGTRNPTQYGSRIASDFAAGFVDREWNIVSGGAYGIDSAAHKGALVAEGRTIAVIASGIDSAYPAGNARLFEEIVENGAIVSEVIPGVIAMPHRFLTRNRLIAALSRSTLVVEAAFRSGSLRTARDAAELMRPVMAIPGPINSPSSEGCHRLIGERAAEIVTSVADAIELISAL